MKANRSFPRPALLAIGCLFALAVFATPRAAAQGTFRESFEGPEHSWQQGDADTRYRIEQRRAQGSAHSGDWSETIRIQASNGSFIHLTHRVPEARVIQELQPSLWVKANRRGIQLMVRVVLPSTRDPDTGKPVTAMLHGDTYSQIGQWQSLKVEQLVTLLGRQQHVLQAQFARRVQIDIRMAYVDQVVLNVYGGQGLNEVWTDDLELVGVVERQRTAEPEEIEVVEDLRGPRVEIRNSILYLEGKPSFVRMVRHQGEALSFLSRIGFNAVYLEGLPSLALLDEAKQAKIWLVCAPPLPRGWDRGTPIPPIGPQFDSVLAWDVGHRLLAGDVDWTHRLATALRQADRSQRRPLVAGVQEELRAHGRYVDIILNERLPIYSSLPLDSFSRWLVDRTKRARAETPFWTTIPTEPPEALVAQWQALGAVPPGARIVDPAQLRLVTYAALGAGARGLFFESRSPLDTNDAPTRLRAQSLELLNLELELVMPWLSSGTYAVDVDANHPNVKATLLSTAGRTKILLPRWSDNEAQWVPGQASLNDVSLVVPGLAESSELFEMTPGGFRNLRRERVAGGVRVRLPEFGLNSTIVVAPDAATFQLLRGRLEGITHRASELIREIAVDEFRSTSDISRRLTAYLNPPPDMERWLGASRAQLEVADRSQSARLDAAVYVASQRAMRPLRMLASEYWQTTLKGRSPLASPFLLTFATLPEHYALAARAETGTFDRNLLPGGDCDDPNLLRSVGWQFETRTVEGINTQIEPLVRGAHDGPGAIRFISTPVSSQESRSVAPLDTAIAWVTTPEVLVLKGQLIRFRGFINIPRSLAGSTDGVMLFDTLSGVELGERRYATSGWQPFELFRIAPEDGAVALSCVLTTPGEAWLDTVSIQVLNVGGGK